VLEKYGVIAGTSLQDAWSVSIFIRKFVVVPSYYGLYSLYNKIRNKGKIVSAGY
jgi:hypothetical protein